MRLSLRIPNDRRAVRTARDSVAELLADLPEPAVDDIRLVVSELVTNCVRHASQTPDIELDIVADDSRLRIDVIDQGPGFEMRSVDDALREGGWGLMIVGRLATRWGIITDGRVHVWFERDVRATGHDGSASGV